MSRKSKIKNILEKNNNANAIRLRMLSRQKRLQKLVDEYGVSETALAAGYAESTLSQYLRVRNPGAIGEEAVSQAESVFKQMR